MSRTAVNTVKFSCCKAGRIQPSRPLSNTANKNSDFVASFFLSILSSNTMAGRYTARTISFFLISCATLPREVTMLEWLFPPLQVNFVNPPFIVSHSRSRYSSHCSSWPKPLDPEWGEEGGGFRRGRRLLWTSSKLRNQPQPYYSIALNFSKCTTCYRTGRWLLQHREFSCLLFFPSFFPVICFFLLFISLLPSPSQLDSLNFLNKSGWKRGTVCCIRMKLVIVSWPLFNNLHVPNYDELANYVSAQTVGSDPHAFSRMWGTPPSP